MIISICRSPPPSRFAALAFTRSFLTDSVPSVPPLPPPPFPPFSPPKLRPTLYPRPRPAAPTRPQSLPPLPPTFGRNQLLPVSNDTHALLESIVSQFHAPIRYAFAYGSGVFEQDGYTKSNAAEGPMLDFMFAVTHSSHFHSINMQQFPNHYPLHSRLFGSSYVSKLEEFGPGVWFNAFVEMNGVRIKYGVTTVDNLCSDLLNWNTLYLAGRMHKPVRIIKNDPRVRLTQQVNLTSAARTALLTLPPEFTATQLFERIAGISYAGDPRMVLPAENRSKVRNIVSKQHAQFRELYHRLVVGLPGVHWPAPHAETVQQDPSPHIRASHLRKLPSNLLSAVRRAYLGSPAIPPIQADETAYWLHLAKDENLLRVLKKETGRIVRYPATLQTMKGIVTVGIGKSLRYSLAKIGKWYSGRSNAR